jgi:hypothetical protein
MVVEWSVECSADDPVLVVPWSVAEAGAAVGPERGDFVNLRENPYDLDQIPEAEQNPPLMQALRALNAARSPVFTAKCDVWQADPEEMEMLRQQLDLLGEGFDSVAGFASYIDLVWRDRSIFASFHQSEQLLHRLQRVAAAAIDEPFVMLDCVLRPALIDLAGPQEGFAVSMYVKAVGPTLVAAKEIWGTTLEAVVALLRSRDLALT